MQKQSVISDIAGTVARIEVTEGQAVSAQQTLLVLESMKMEIPVEAPVSGQIAAVHVKVGDQVTEEQLLITLQLKSESGAECA